MPYNFGDVLGWVQKRHFGRAAIDPDDQGAFSRQPDDADAAYALSKTYKPPAAPAPEDDVEAPVSLPKPVRLASAQPPPEEPPEAKPNTFLADRAGLSADQQGQVWDYASKLGGPQPTTAQKATQDDSSKGGRDLSWMSTLGRELTGAAGLISGVKGDTSVYDSLDKQAEEANKLKAKAVEDYVRGKFEGQKLELERGKMTQEALDKAAALKREQDRDAATAQHWGEEGKRAAATAEEIARHNREEEAIARDRARKGGDSELAELRERRIGLMQEKLDMTRNQNEAYGFEDLDPAQHKDLLPEQSAALAEQRAARDRIHEGVTRLLKMYEENPKAFPGSVAMAEFKAMTSELVPTAAKAGGFGQLTSGHQELLQSAIDSPDEFQNYINAGRFPALLRELDHGSNSALAAKAASLGKREKVATGGMRSVPPSQASFGGGAAPAGDSDIVMVLPPGPPGTTKPVPVHKSQLEDALRAGGKVVSGG